MFDLAGKSALATGASGGIGAAIARALQASRSAKTADRKRAWESASAT